MIIFPGIGRETMEWQSSFTAAIPAILLIAAVTIAGCTGSPQAPAATPAPVPSATTPAAGMSPAVPSATAVPFNTVAYTWTTETPYAGQPYTKTYSFHGTGDYEDFTFSTDQDATWIFTLTHPNQGIFTVILKDARGSQLDMLANEGGGGDSRKTAFLKAGNYAFDIQADAPWYITMTTG
jgi:hypothetical protein